MEPQRVQPPNESNRDVLNSKNSDMLSNGEITEVKNSEHEETIKQEQNTGEVTQSSNDDSTNNIINIPEIRGPPIHEIVGGSSVRRYLNQYLTQHLLDGLKEVNKTKPADPLKALGEFLIKRSEQEKSNN